MTPSLNFTTSVIFPSPGVRRWARVSLFLFAGFWIFNQIDIHRSARYQYSQDVGRILVRALDLVDTGQPILEGNPFFGDYRLGPLADYLAAIPLLVTRDIRAQYWFASLLIWLAVPLFFLTLKSLVPEGWGKWLGTMVFAFAWPLIRTPYPVNKEYLPLFLVLYLFLLIKAVGFRAYANILLWPVIGLVMQLHLSAVWLVPATYLAVMPHRKRSLIWQTLAGWLLFSLAQFPLYRQLLQGESGRPPFSAVVSLPGLNNYLLRLGGFFLGTPLLFGLGGALFGLAALLIGRRLWNHFPEHRALLRAGFFAIPGGLLVLPFLATMKDTFDLDYLFPEVVFWALLIVFLFHYLEDKTSVPGGVKRLVVAGAVFLALTAASQVGMTALRYRDNPRAVQLTLTDQEVVARRLMAQLHEHAWRDVRLLELLYNEKDGELKLRSSNLMTYGALCLYLDPDIRPFLNAARPQITVYVQVLAACCRPRRAELEPPPAATLFDRFDTENLAVTLYWSTVDDPYFLRSIDAINQESP